MDVRTKTGLIIRKGNEYLVGTIYLSTDLRWSISPYDAWFTRNLAHATIVAEKVGGEIMLFNPVVGRIRELVA